VQPAGPTQACDAPGTHSGGSGAAGVAGVDLGAGAAETTVSVGGSAGRISRIAARGAWVPQ